MALQKKPFEIKMEEASGKITKFKKVVSELVGGRKTTRAKITSMKLGMQVQPLIRKNTQHKVL